VQSVVFGCTSLAYVVEKPGARGRSCMDAGPGWKCKLIVAIWMDISVIKDHVVNDPRCWAAVLLGHILKQTLAT
jgi:hypothetical protein